MRIGAVDCRSRMYSDFCTWRQALSAAFTPAEASTTSGDRRRLSISPVLCIQPEPWRGYVGCNQHSMGSDLRLDKSEAR